MHMESLTVQYSNIVLAAASQFAIGMVWYSPLLFGNLWMKLAKMEPDPKKPMSETQKRMMQALATNFIMSLITAYVLAHFIILFGITTVQSGMILAFWVWVGFYATTALGDHMYSKNSPKLLLINSGYRAISIATMCAILIGLA